LIYDKSLPKKYTTGITISNDTKLNTISFADNHVVIANSEDNLQIGLHALHQTVQKFGMKISHQETKIMALKGTEPINKKQNCNRQHDIRTSEHFHIPGL
jgi:hypothetical protein